jgi:hypothetical protein
MYNILLEEVVTVGGGIEEDTSAAFSVNNVVFD